MILGIDVGGTFTDFVLLDDAGQIRIHKLLTSVRDQSQSILQGIADLEVGPEVTVVHGATVATNALLERRGARTALIATEGFCDVLEIGRQTRPDLYALHPTRPAPLVPADRRFELPERVDKQGTIIIPLDLEATDAVVRHLLEQAVESVAISFLFSFLNPTHERSGIRTHPGSGRRPGTLCLPFIRGTARIPRVRTDLNNGHQRLRRPLDGPLSVQSGGGAGTAALAHYAIQRRHHLCPGRPNPGRSHRPFGPGRRRRGRL